jgi:hypothetical protein
VGRKLSALRHLYRYLLLDKKIEGDPTPNYETQHRKQPVIHLKRKAAQLGLQIIEVAAAA